MLLLFDHISKHMNDYYFFLALNDLGAPYTHNCSIYNIIYSICIGRRKCLVNSHLPDHGEYYWPFTMRFTCNQWISLTDDQ